MTTATDIGLDLGPVRFLNAYVINVTTSLNLTSGPSTATVSLVEDECSSPKVIFQPPKLGQFVNLVIGNKFKFSGVVTKYDKQISNISGKTISVNISDVREIMKSIPIILAPGFRTVAKTIKTGSECSVIDAFGAFDDFENTGINLSGWNQAGMTYENIVLSLSGGQKTIGSIVFKVPQEVGKAFGETYVFDFSEVTPLVNPEHRVNTNLISLADFVQELADSHSFDWYVETNGKSGSNIDVKIKVIDRSSDNINIELQSFLDDNVDKVITATSGVELRNDVACSVLVGAPVESLRKVNIEGMANNPVDLSEEDGDNRYFMSEIEMRIVLANKQAWLSWLSCPSDNGGGGGIGRYGVSTTAPGTVIKAFSTSVGTQIGVDPDLDVDDEDRDIEGRIYEKLKGHAEASYGKRFLFTPIADVDYIDAAWTVDVVAGNNDANEFFRDENGKTRAYVEFAPLEGGISLEAAEGLLGFGGSFVVGKGEQGAQPLNLELTDFLLDGSFVEADKSDYLIDNPSLYVSATIEEGNIVRINSAVFENKPNENELENIIIDCDPDADKTDNTAELIQLSSSKRASIRSKLQHGNILASIQIAGRAYQPTFVLVPTRARFNRYGPVFSSSINANSEGKLEIEQDEGFAPWEFGGTSIMLDAMQFKVDNSSSNVKEIQTAEVTIEGFPQFSIGESLGRNSNINNININFGGQVTTNYKLQSFQRKFGELSKEELAFLSLLARRGGPRIFPQNTVEFIERNRVRIAKQFSGFGTSSGATFSGGTNSFE